MAKVSSMTEISLTSLGRKKVDSMSGGGHGFAVLAHLYDSGGMSFGELGTALKLNPGRLLGLIKLLKREGFVTIRTESIGSGVED